MCSQISDTGLCHIEQKHTYTLWDFKDTQVKQLQKVLTALYRKIQSGLVGCTLAQVWTKKGIQKKDDNQNVSLLLHHKMWESLHSRAVHVVVLPCKYVNYFHHFFLLLSDTNWPKKVSRPGERAGNLCLSQLFVTSNATRKLTCVHSNRMDTLVFADVQRQIWLHDALLCLWQLNRWNFHVWHKSRSVSILTVWAGKFLLLILLTFIFFF